MGILLQLMHKRVISIKVLNLLLEGLDKHVNREKAAVNKRQFRFWDLWAFLSEECQHLNIMKVKEGKVPLCADKWLSTFFAFKMIPNKS